MKIAFLGLGRMGRELANHLLDADHSLVVWNRTPSATDEFVRRDARRADSPAAAVADAELVITVLFGGDVVREVVTTADLPIPAGASWVDITTVSPAEADEFATWAENHRVHYAHSPVIGSLGPARQAKLGVLLGGDPAAVDIARPVVSRWADPERIRIYDTAAKAAGDKLINNLGLAVAMQGVVEALRLGHSSGLSTDQVLAALDKSMLSAMKDLKGGYVSADDFSNTQFSAALLSKDARLMMHTSRYPLPALAGAHEALDNAARSGHGDDDFSVIAAYDANS